jgi:hypothetical protein
LSIVSKAVRAEELGVNLDDYPGHSDFSRKFGYATDMERFEHLAENLSNEEQGELISIFLKFYFRWRYRDGVNEETPPNELRFEPKELDRKFWGVIGLDLQSGEYVRIR